MHRLGVPATNRASFYIYSVRDEVDRLAEGVRQAKQLLG
jgi:selenocysteine lyase/cysteine desulfurase